MPRLFTRIKVPRHVFLTEDAFEMIGRLADGRGPNEVGGPAVGYATVDDALVITAVSGPGRHGICTPTSVTIDGADATAFCAAMAKASGNTVQYLGDWHLHNEQTVEPSPRDFKALRILPRQNAWRYPIISLILNGSLDHYVCLYHGAKQPLECSIL